MGAYSSWLKILKQFVGVIGDPLSVALALTSKAVLSSHSEDRLLGTTVAGLQD